MEEYLTHNTVPSAEVLRRCLRKGTIHSAFTIVLCGSSYKNKGVQQVLDAVVDYLPAPTDVESIRTVHADGELLGMRGAGDHEEPAGRTGARRKEEPRTHLARTHPAGGQRGATIPLS